MWKQSVFTYDQLEHLEKKKTATLKATELSAWRSLFHLEGAGIPDTLTDPVMMLGMTLYVIFRILRYKFPEEVDENDNVDYLATIATYLTFFQTIMFGKCYARYWEQFVISATIQGCIGNLSYLARYAMEPNLARRFMRYINACHVMGYVAVSDTYTYDNFFREVNGKWKLLTDREVKRMEAVYEEQGPHACFKELLAWAFGELQAGIKNGSCPADLGWEFRGMTLKLRGNIGSLFDYDDQPLPYFYSYFVVVLSFIYVPLFCATVGWVTPTDDVSNDILAPIIVFANSFFIVGLRVMSSKLSKPYGGDVEDLRVLELVNSSCKGTFHILATPPPPGGDNWNAAEEEELAEARNLSLGSLWKGEIGGNGNRLVKLGHDSATSFRSV